MKIHKHGVLIALALLGLLAAQSQAQIYTNYITIDDPLANKGIDSGTYVEGISGNVVVGYYTQTNGLHGFIHDLNTTNYTTLDYPSGVASPSTYAYGIDDTNIVGYYLDNTGTAHGFLYNDVSGIYTSLSDPSASYNTAIYGTYAQGISSSNIVGYYLYSQGAQDIAGFLATPNGGGYNYAGFYDPSITNPTRTYASGISGDNIVGYSVDSGLVVHGYIYNRNTTSFTPLISPAGGGSKPFGISGNNVVGYYGDATGNHGFLYNMVTSNYTTINVTSNTNRTYAQGISGNAIVGYYYDASTVAHGFVVAPVATPPPVISSITMTNESDVVLGGTKPTYILTATNGVSGAACALLATTNLALPLNQWTGVITNFFDATGSCTFTDSPAQNVPQTFYRLSEMQ